MRRRRKERRKNKRVGRQRRGKRGVESEEDRKRKRHLLDLKLRDIVQRTVRMQLYSHSAFWELRRPLIWLQLSG